MKKLLIASLTTLTLIGGGCMNTTTNTNTASGLDTETMLANTNEAMDTNSDMVGGDALDMKVRNDISGSVSTEGWDTEVSEDPTFAYMHPTDWDPNADNAVDFTVQIEPTDPAKVNASDDGIYINGQPFYVTEATVSNGTEVMYTAYLDDTTISFAYTSTSTDAVNRDTFMTILSTFSPSDTPMGVVDDTADSGEAMLQ